MAITTFCRYCKGSGTVVATEKKSGSLFGFSCSCVAGAKYKALPTWNDRLKFTYIPDYDTTLSVTEEEVSKRLNTTQVTSNPEPF